MGLRREAPLCIDVSLCMFHHLEFSSFSNMEWGPFSRGDIGKVKTADWIPETVTIKSVASMEDFWGALEKEHPEYKAVYIDGGRTIQSFLKAGLMHRLNLTRIPTLLGEGIPLFYGTKVDLHHVSTKSYSNGFVTSTYDVKYDEK